MAQQQGPVFLTDASIPQPLPIGLPPRAHKAIQRNIAAVSGSLYKHSYNTLALRAVAQLAPAQMAFVPLGYEDVPIYNQDVCAPTPN